MKLHVEIDRRTTAGGLASWAADRRAGPGVARLALDELARSVLEAARVLGEEHERDELARLVRVAQGPAYEADELARLEPGARATLGLLARLAEAARCEPVELLEHLTEEVTP